MAGADIRGLEGRDIDRVVQLTALESWGYSSADIRRLSDLSDGGCFVAERDDRVLGFLSTTPYGLVAYIGAVIVDPAVRGEGIGETLMQTALEHLESHGAETVRLNAYRDVIPFYERLGFRREYANVRWEGMRIPVAAGGSARRARAVDLPDLVALDATYFGARREALLRRLLEEFPEAFLVADGNGRIRGYLVGNTTGSSVEIAPWIAEPDTPGIAEELFGGLLEVCRRESFAFSGPGPNPRPHAFAREHGFREGFASVRMVRGKQGHGGRPEGVWSFAGLEKG